MVELVVRKQASVIAFGKVFLLMGGVFLCAMPWLMLFRTGRVRVSGAAH